VDNNGNTPLAAAIESGENAMVDLFREHGANVPDSTTETLFNAAKEGELDQIKALVCTGVKINTKGYNDKTLLHSSIRSDNLQLVDWLINHGLDVNARDKGGCTPLHFVASPSGTDRTDIAESLLSHGADINAKDGEGETVLHEAATYHNQLLMKSLLSHGADINTRNIWDITPLHRYVSNNDPEFVEFLVKHGADVNAKDNDGRTALSIAMEYGHSEIVKLLKEHGAT